jgi:GT2 family glycosyltransferase
MGIAAADLYLLGRYLPSRTLGLEEFAAVYESPEFTDVWEPWANLDNQLFLINVFMTIAHRLPDAQEFEGLVRELDFNQVTRLRVVRSLMNEHATRKVLTWGAEHREGPEVSGNPSQDSERCGETSFPIVHSFTLLGSRKLVTASEWRAEIFSRDKRLQTEVELAMLRLRSKQSSCALTYEKKDGSTSSPKVSVLVSVYNGANYIDAFAKALIRQTIFPETEVIVLDADSTDDSVAKLQHAFGEWPNVKLNQLSSKLSVYEAWNIGAKIATAPYLTNWNLDDTRHPCSLEVQADYLNRNQSIDVCYQDVWVYFDPNLDFEEIQRHCLLDIVPPISPRTLLSSNYVHNAPMWRRGLHDSLGYFDTNYISAADWEFWLRCATRGVQFGKCPIPTVAYYVNPVGVSTRPGTAGITESSSIRDRYRAALRYPDVECDYSFLPFGRYPSRSERIAATFTTKLMRA